MDKVILGSFPTGTLDMKIMSLVFFGRSTSSVPQIDSRLHMAVPEFRDVSDNLDKVMGHKRCEILVKDCDSFAVVLYRLYDIWESDSYDEEVRDEAYSMFTQLCYTYLGVEDGAEIFLLEYPWFRYCPRCSFAEPDELELQDQVYHCHNCGWDGDFQSEWPYLHADGRYIGRIDGLARRKLGGRNGN